MELYKSNLSHEDLVQATIYMPRKLRVELDKLKQKGVFTKYHHFISVALAKEIEIAKKLLVFILILGLYGCNATKKVDYEYEEIHYFHKKPLKQEPCLD